MGDGDTIARSVWIVLVLVLVASSLFARRIPLARLFSWSLGWVALFFGCYLLFTWFEPQFVAWQQSRRGGTVQSTGTGAGESQPVALGRSVSIPMSEDGHYWVDAVANGRKVRFLLDSGASITALSQSTAETLGLTIEPMHSGVLIQTANGPVTAERSTIASIEIESAIRASDLPVVVSPAFGEINVLGMNFLNKLKSWRVEGGRMTLQAQ